MSRSNPMHHESSLHPVMQQALAPFAPPYPPLSAAQRQILDNFDRNIEMFDGLGQLGASKAAALREARLPLLRYLVGEISILALPIDARNLVEVIPADMLGS